MRTPPSPGKGHLLKKVPTPTKGMQQGNIGGERQGNAPDAASWKRMRDIVVHQGHTLGGDPEVTEACVVVADRNVVHARGPRRSWHTQDSHGQIARGVRSCMAGSRPRSGMSGSRHQT